jgi:hypothetical protein
MRPVLASHRPGNLALGLGKMIVRVAALALVTLALLAPQAAGDEIEVDLELVLAVDISFSMDSEEQRLQRDGHVAAIRHPEVIAAIRGGLHGRIALAYVEWAGAATQDVVVPWMLIDGPKPPRPSRRPLRRAHCAGLVARRSPGRCNIPGCCSKAVAFAGCAGWSTYRATGPTTRACR